MATAKVIIKGEDQLKGPLNQAKSELNSFGQAAAGAGNMLKAAFGAAAVAVIVKGIKEISKAVAECINEFKNQIEVDTRLQATLKATGQQYVVTAAEVKEFASNLQDATRFGNDAVESAAALLLATKKFSKEGLERTIELSADLAEAMGTDLASAASTLERALIEPGEGLNKLRTIGITFTDAEKDMITELKNAGKEFEAQQIILDKVEAAYGGMAESIASIDTSTLDKIKNVWGDLKKDLGSVFTNVLGPVFDWIYKTLKWLERLANQVAEKSNYNKYIREGNAQALADNWTEDSLKQYAGKASAAATEAYGTLGSNYWLNYYLDKYDMALKEFVRLSTDQRTDLLMALSNQDATFVGMVNQQLVAYDAAVDELHTITEAQQIQYREQLEDEKKFRLEQAKKAEQDEADRIAAEKKAFDDAVDAILKKYGSMDENYQIRSIEAEIKQIEDLLANPSISSEDAATLQIALDYNRQLLEEINKLNINLNDIYGEVQGISNGNMHFEIQNATFDIKDDIFSYNHNNPLAYGNATGVDTLSILGIKGVKDLRLAPEGLTDYAKEVTTLINKYINLSTSYQKDQEALVNEEIRILEEAAASIKDLDPESTLNTYLPEIIRALKGNDLESTIIKKIGPITLTGKEEIAQFSKGLNAVFNDFTSQTGEFGDAVSRLVQNMSTMGPLIGAIVTALHYVIEGFVEVFGDMLQEFAYYGLEPLREIGRVIGDVVMPLLEEFMPSIQQSADILIQIFDAIGIVLKPIAVLIGTVLGPILKLITNFLEHVLLPILKGIASIFLMITSVVEFFADCIKWVVAEIRSWFGGGANKVRVRSPSEIYEGYMEEMWMGTDANSGSYGVSGTTNASYQGSTTIYLNVYNQGTVVGEDGIQEFAIMIRDELANVAYYGR